MNSISKFAYSPFDFPIIALSGYAGSGKSTAAEAMEIFGYSRFSFGNPIKEILSRVYHVPIECFYDAKLKLIAHPNLNGLTPRRAMQLIGTEGFRNLIDQNTWTKCLEHDIVKYRKEHPECKGVIVDDLRFFTEEDCMLHHNATTVFISNHRVTRTSEHQSETEMDAISQRVHFVLDNNSTIDMLRQNAISLVNNLRVERAKAKDTK